MERRVLLASVAGRVFYDVDLDNVIDPEDFGLAGWTVFADLNDNGVFDGSADTYPAADVPKSILDNTTVSSTMSLAAGGTVADVDVRLSITHTYTSDLDIFLVAPDGTRVELSTDNGGSGDNFNNTLFDDDAATSITAGSAPFAGTFRPEGSLATLIGKPVAGNWRLEVGDDAGGDVGSLTAWSLIIRTGEAASTTSANGSYLLQGLPAGNVVVRQITQPGHNPFRTSATVNLPTAASAMTNVHFGNRLTPGTITGTVFADYDRDRVRDPDEPGLAGRTVYLDNNDNSLLDVGEITTTTDSAGDYLFQNVVPGLRRVRQLLPDGWRQTSPSASARPGEAVAIDNPTPTPIPPAVVAPESQPYLQDQVILEVSDRTAFDRALAKGGNRWIRSQLAMSRAGSLGKIGSSSMVIVPVAKGSDPAKLLEPLRTLKGISAAHLNFVYGGDPRELTPNDPSYASQYHHPLMRNNLAWDVTQGSGVRIAITDDGFQLAHPDLAPNYFTNPNEIPGNGIDDDGNGYVDDVRGWDFTNSTTLGTGDADPNPPTTSDSHGTHVAGIAAARTNNAIGVAGTAGQATIVPLRFYGTGSWTSTVVFNAYKYAADIGARILSVSYNIDGFANDSLFLSALNYVYDRGVLHFNSAGNNNQLNPPRQKFDQALFVANTNSSDVRSGSSNYGTGVDISAPGESILSTVPNNTYASFTGTSMATPNAAAVAALIWSKNPTWTRDQVAAQLLATADNIDAVNPAFAGLLGTGRVNSFRAVTQTIAAPRLRGIDGLPAEGAILNSLPAGGSIKVRLLNVLDPASFTPGTVRFYGAGSDDAFGTSDDVSFNANLAAGTVLRVGTNEVTFTVPQALAGGLWRFEVVSGANAVRDPFGNPLDGNGDGIGGDNFVRNFRVRLTTVANTSDVASGGTADLDFGAAENVAPTVASTVFAFDTAHELRLAFSEAMRLPAASAFVIRNLDTNAVVPTSDYAVTFDGPASALKVAFSPALADGNYRMTLASADAADLFGNALDGDNAGGAGGDLVHDFSFFRGDMNRDGRINNQDIAAFVQGLTDPNAFQRQFGYGPSLLGDVNGDDLFNNQDIATFVARLTSGRPVAFSDAPVAAASSSSRRPLVVAASDDDSAGGSLVKALID